MNSYTFTNTWFAGVKTIWDSFIPIVKPQKICEIGSYEGASACYLIDTLASTYNIELHCIDTWNGGIEHDKDGFAHADMNEVEARFHQNISKAISVANNKVELTIHKELSDFALARLLSNGRRNYFDLIYIDGSHQASDVLCDAVLAFKLLKVGGHIIFDDYLWSEPLPYGKDPLRCPKPAIDAFINLNFRKLSILQAPLYQLYIVKDSD